LTASGDGGEDRSALGSYLRTQRRLAHLTLRQVAELSKVSNPYLSQIERGLHEPSVRILRSIAVALNISAEDVLKRAGLVGDKDAPARTDDAPQGADGPDTVSAIENDRYLTEAQKRRLIASYRSYRQTNEQ
jgi:transcriptional regulator with XRE-family HTH domain